MSQAVRLHSEVFSIAVVVQHTEFLPMLPMRIEKMSQSQLLQAQIKGYEHNSKMIDLKTFVKGVHFAG